MVIFSLLEILVVFLVLWFLWTQLVQPIINKKPVFPAFGKEGDLNYELDKLDTQEHVLDLEGVVKSRRKQVVKKQKEVAKQ